MRVREIEKELVGWLDERLAGNGLAKHAIEIKEPRLLMVEAARACVGVREEGGNNNGPMVRLLQKTIGGASKESWCMSFQQSLIAYAELKTGLQSRLVASEHCLTVWAKSSEKCRVRFFPLPGAIVIWRHGDTTNGHTGIFLEADGDQMMTIEGNTSSGLSKNGSVVRDGGGVYLCKRSMKQNGDLRVVGFLKPF
jgi:hypothetical protein